MVKADPKRNYYAELDLTPDTDTESIKKQFRLLARQYHPDRNPGKEAEFVPKFQAIQAAHEILSDPQERRKYDEARRKLGYTASYARTGTTSFQRSPYATYSNYPPPPRRTATTKGPPPPRPTFNTTASSSGASRFANIPRQGPPQPPPPPRPPRAKDDADVRENVFKAWQHMHPGATRQGFASDADRSGSDQEGSFRRGQTAYEHLNKAKPNLGRSHTTRMPRRSGFDPSTPGADEGPATGASAYFTSSRYDRPAPPPPPPFPPPPPSPRPGPPKASPLTSNRPVSSEDIPFAEGNPRLRTPYVNVSGEKTSVFSENIRRSSSVRDAPGYAKEAEAAHASKPTTRASSARHRSASPASRQSFSPNPFAQKSTGFPPPPPGAGTSHSRPRPTSDRPKATPFSLNSSPSNSEDEFDRAGQDRSSQDPAFRPKAEPSGKWRRNGSTSQNGSQVNGSFGKAEGTPNGFIPPKFQTAGLDEQDDSTNQKPAIFRQDEWAKTFKEPSWVYPPPKPPSPTRPGSAPPKRSKTPVRSRTQSRQDSRPPTMSKKPSISEVVDEDELPNGRGPLPPEPVRPVHTGSPDAMDIDSESSIKTSGKGPRLVPVQPMREDWRDPAFPHLSRQPPPPLGPPPQPQAVKATHPPPPTAGPPPSSNRNASGGLNLNDLKNVTPLTSSKEGLTGLKNDLTANLPFKSQASPTHPTKSFAPQSLDLPKVPKVPAKPDVLTKQTWQTYLARMGTYVGEWTRFNQRILDHFMGRQMAACDLAAGGPGWLGAVGEGTNQEGFGSYMKAQREDERVQVHWSMSSERHRKAMEEFERVRERVLREGLK